MLKKLNFRLRRVFLILSSFVLLIILSSCRGAGAPTGKLPVDEIYAEAGKDTVTVGELWNELKWSSKDVLTDKINEAVMKDYNKKVSLVMDHTYGDLSNDDKNLIAENLTEEKFNELKAFYSERLQDYVIEDVYNFEFSSADSYEIIETVTKYDAKKLLQKYEEEMYLNYGIENIDDKSISAMCQEAADDETKKENYLTIAKKFNNIYYLSLAKELLAYDKLEEDIKEAYDNRNTEDEDDLGYFSQTDYTSKFKSDFGNQHDLNLILIRFATTDEFNATLRSFGIKQYNDNWVYIPSKDGLPDAEGKGGTSFSDYCDYYDDLTTSDIKSLDGALAAQELTTYDIALIYIQMYNYLYGGYRDIIYSSEYLNQFNSVDLRKITADIRQKNQTIIQQEGEEALERRFQDIVKVLSENKDSDGIDTFYTREQLNEIDSSFSNYLYETLSVPYTGKETLSYSTDSQSYKDSRWIAFKLSEETDSYADLYNKDTVDDDLYDSIAANADLKAAIEKKLKEDEITSTAISNALKERTDEVEIKIYDEALEISYSTSNSDYSRTYGKAPNENVLATIKYNDKTYHLNIVEDTTDENALSDGVYNILERKDGITTAIDILSRKVVKQTKAYSNYTKEDRENYEQQLEYVLAAFSNDYYSSSGYPSTIGKYNFMMLYFHTANIDDIINNVYRVNGTSAKLLTNYNSDALLNLFYDYSQKIYNNYFSISGKRLVVYLDADDDNEKDDLEDWKTQNYSYVTTSGETVNTTRGELAKALVKEIYNEVSHTTGSHSDALTALVTEINESARALFEENPIAPENQWAKYRKAGLKVELVDVEAKNDTTSLDFNLKQRLYDIFNSEYYSLNNNTPTEYLEEINNPNYVNSLSSKQDILETKDGYNLLLITKADFQTSAEFKEEDDKLGMYKDLSVYYNDQYNKIGSIYNDDKTLTLEQIRLYVLEYVTTSASNLSPSQLSNAYTNFLSPVISRYTNTQTQREIIIYFIEKQHNISSINFVNQNDKYEKIIAINHRTADDYIENYFEEDTTGTLETYNQWWDDLKENVGQMLLTEGEE